MIYDNQNNTQTATLWTFAQHIFPVDRFFQIFTAVFKCSESKKLFGTVINNLS